MGVIGDSYEIIRIIERMGMKDSKLNFKVIFISNYINHYQAAFSEEMKHYFGENYIFMETEPMEEERLKLGWEIPLNLTYLKKSYTSEKDYQQCMELILEADVVIVGSAPQKMISERIARDSLTLRYSERVYKTGQWRVFSPRGIYHMNKAHRLASRKNVFLLCASAYLPCDMNLFGFYTGKMYKWGYFPELFLYKEQELLDKKRNEVIEIVWAARFIDWKHPEIVIWLAEKLKQLGVKFHVTMIGSGDMLSQCERLISKKKLVNEITILGAISPLEVRQYMEKSNVFLMTSDYNEGWGVTLMEAMNSGCVVISSHAAGATPSLIRHNFNGFIFKSESKSDLLKQMMKYIKNKKQAEKMGINAYHTIRDEWNPKHAVQNLIKLMDSLLNKKRLKIKQGPCSKAEVIQEWNMLKRLKE